LDLICESVDLITERLSYNHAHHGAAPVGLAQPDADELTRVVGPGLDTRLECACVLKIMKHDAEGGLELWSHMTILPSAHDG